METKIKNHIDRMSYYEMLKLNRFAYSRHSYFQGETGIYFSKIMNEKEQKLLPGQKVRISKNIGWEK
jgi:hypothetical protein